MLVTIWFKDLIISALFFTTILYNLSILIYSLIKTKLVTPVLVSLIILISLTEIESL